MSRIIVPEPVLEQLEQVRQDGGTNMVSRHGVQQVASELDLYELVLFCEDHRRDWAKVLRRFGEWLSD